MDFFIAVYSTRTFFELRINPIGCWNRCLSVWLHYKIHSGVIFRRTGILTIQPIVQHQSPMINWKLFKWEKCFYLLATNPECVLLYTNHLCCFHTVIRVDRIRFYCVNAKANTTSNGGCKLWTEEKTVTTSVYTAEHVTNRQTKSDTFADTTSKPYKYAAAGIHSPV